MSTSIAAMTKTIVEVEEWEHGLFKQASCVVEGLTR